MRGGAGAGGTKNTHVTNGGELRVPRSGPSKPPGAPARGSPGAGSSKLDPAGHAKTSHASNLDTDDGDGEVNARGAGKARLSNAVCNSTVSDRPTLDGLPLMMPFSRTVMGKRGKLRKDDIFIHRTNYAKNRLQDVVPDPSTLPENAEAIWTAYPFRRCALVGNSGSLTGKGLGPAIDDHDVVVRLNQAPTKGYASDVGKKATFRLLNSLWTGLYATVPNSASALKVDGALDQREGARLGEAQALPMERNATLIVTRAEAQSFARLRDGMSRLRPDVKLLMLAPRIVTAAKWLMREYRIRLCEAGYGPFPGGNTPSSGLVAAYIMVQTCDRLNLFGFGGGDEEAGRGHNKYHYYTGVGHRNVGTAVHSWGAELELLGAMARDGLVTMCTSGEQEECVDGEAEPRVRRRELPAGIVRASSKHGHDAGHDPIAAALGKVAAKDNFKLEVEEKEETGDEEEEAEEEVPKVGDVVDAGLTVEDETETSIESGADDLIESKDTETEGEENEDPDGTE